MARPAVVFLPKEYPVDREVGQAPARLVSVEIAAGADRLIVVSEQQPQIHRLAGPGGDTQQLLPQASHSSASISA
ncbi:hypothetical protein [Marinobacterium iners]|uniref:hypothetical protein n=1 Tax=Marinobacterium iners TaxID=48076 RepID=UPI001A903B8F|nr:hypothetical protein [Marinobacterium iners]